MLLLILVGFAYAVAHCLWYAGQPMGAHPVLDGKENLQLAWDIADGALPKEPFYRAPLYPLVISLGMGLGLPESLWPDFARLINLLSWLASLWLVARLARGLWDDDRAALGATAIWAFYPVGLFFLGDPLDITLSIALLLGGLDRAVAFTKTASAQAALASGFLLALAALTRPQMWAIALSIPVLLIFIACYFGGRAPEIVDEKNPQKSKRPPRWTVFFILVGLAIPALMMGAFNQKISGKFAIMPTQGAFNLWAANKPGAHGKYYAQGIEIYQHDQHMNPARVESIHQYREAMGPDAPLGWEEVNDYWRAQTREMISDDPIGWFGRLARKGYYLLNHYEQYNNKTYSVHRELSPWLRFNFLGWGILLVAAAPLIFFGRKNPFALAVILFAFAALSAGLILTYVSARFRLPLAPLLAIIAGGWFTLPWRGSNGRGLALGGVACLLAAGLAFTSLFAVREPDTRVQDYLLLGYAALDAGQDEVALDWANTALENNPSRLAAKELLVVARFNLDLARLIESGEKPDNLALARRIEDAMPISQISPRVRYVYGVYLNWSTMPDLARPIWEGLLGYDDSVTQSALTALIMVSEPTSRMKIALAQLPPEEWSPPLRVAIMHRNGQALSSEDEALLDQLQLIYD
ncbi:transglutaminaseTgpA domain-containing protein [Cerasicoccus fimbriatus]|uniref:transglutaminaseTgpA domain-containing protein n=1 Tax=Cerasicoccus fimbriatus TaxID=3014554 RepID=UPI0022B5C3DA|nr:transglutaminaseTgpA domain-containing protein [Cerasicoccus sp. TK19100]